MFKVKPATIGDCLPAILDNEGNVVAYAPDANLASWLVETLNTLSIMDLQSILFDAPVKGEPVGVAGSIAAATRTEIRVSFLKPDLTGIHSFLMEVK